MSTDNQKSVEIKDERDYAIRKGKVLEKFTQEFFTKFKNYPLYRQVYEALIRDKDPYEIIELLIEINSTQFDHIKEITPWISPNYQLTKQKINGNK